VRYIDGQEIQVGDKVHMGDDDGGIVVCDIGAGKFSPSYSENEWAYLKEGVVIAFPRYGILHMTDTEADLELIARQPEC
jgi:hypothetical protein